MKEERRLPEREIFDHWNSQSKVIRHRSFEAHRGSIKRALVIYKKSELELAIRRYNLVLGDKQNKYWLTHKWTIGEFLSRKGGKWIDIFISDDWEDPLLTAQRSKIDDDFWESI